MQSNPGEKYRSEMDRLRQLEKDAKAIELLRPLPSYNREKGREGKYMRDS
jgi:hypothetical protein